MAAVGREKGLLKLVHPGGFVERYRRPVAAAEVMKKNPRHCVTRPDVFKFPWIVVRPESLLNPGNVFYVVPNHTIYRLLHGDDPLNRSNSRPSTLANASFKLHHSSNLCSYPKLHQPPRWKQERSVEKIVCKGVVDGKHDCKRGVDKKVEVKCVNRNEVVLKSCLRKKEDHERPAWKKYRRVRFALPEDVEKKKVQQNKGSAR